MINLPTRFMDINRAYLQRIRKMTPAQRLMIAIELTDTVREVAIKGIMNFRRVSYAKARKILRERLAK